MKERRPRTFITSEVFSGQAGSAWLSGGYPVPAGQVIVQFAGEQGYHLGALLRRQRWPRCDGGAEVLGAHDLSPRLTQDGTQQHNAFCAGAGVVTRHRRSSHRPQVYLTVVQDAGARRGRGPDQ